ncbi:LamG-like jellyroll fold domain-containing protein [Micromonospora sp. NBC_01813]|uniref:LamG-like jellyroll fold domain-containing protein n=1 Tax=Micromonospora sp. NBC_01813 TaxID=2975988 RepID=UPI002DDC080F|nr:LamG-like jellyroll fold domain-containing protein [Micromonospora sp. NBC_01813]WSA11177.1 hypothetical protein OG958_10600 [Micromonospora sp. NBC_01813]
MPENDLVHKGSTAWLRWTAAGAGALVAVTLLPPTAASAAANQAPERPTQVTAHGRNCQPGTGRVWAITTTPTFAARASDADAGQQSLTTTFSWRRVGQPAHTAQQVQHGTGNPSVASAAVPSAAALEHGKSYLLRARTSDGTTAGPWSAPCRFTVDVVAPQPPSAITSADYPVSTPNQPPVGGVGIPGIFAISPPADAAGIVGYAYTLDSGIGPGSAPTIPAAADGSATLELQPTRDGFNTLRVWAKDQAGLASAMVEYDFLVAGGNAPVAHWGFDDGAAVGADGTGNGNELAIVGATTGPGRSSPALSLTAAGDHAATTGPVSWPHPTTATPLTLRTDLAFTLSAWARLDSTGTSQTVVTVDGSTTSVVAIGYDAAADRWRFTMADADSAGAALISVDSDAAAVPGRWTHLAATYHKTYGTLQLYVNGTRQNATAALAGGVAASGPVTVGQATRAGAATDQFFGQLDDVRVYQRAVSESELREQARPGAPQISFPNGATAALGTPIPVTFDAGGDANVTEFRYSVGAATLGETAPLAVPGGSTTVTVTPNALGELPLFAASRTANGLTSAFTISAVHVLAAPVPVSGTVYGADFMPVGAGVPVTMEPGARQTTTDASGVFSFADVAPGEYTVTARSGPGDCALVATETISVPGTANLALFLMPAGHADGSFCQELSQPYTPAAGVSLGLSGDNAVTEVALPFPVTFYGQTYNSAWVDTNGILTFTDPGGSHPVPASIPTAGGPDAMIAAFWDDLIVDEQAEIVTATSGSFPFREFVVEWRNVRRAANSDERVTFQIVFAQLGGSVSVSYSGIDPASPGERGGSATIGIENAAGTAGLQYSSGTPVLTDDRAMLFRSAA